MLIKMPKEKGPGWNYVTVQTNDRPNIQAYALCTFTFSLQTFTIFFRINAFINVYCNFFSRLSHLWYEEVGTLRRSLMTDCLVTYPRPWCVRLLQMTSLSWQTVINTNFPFRAPDLIQNLYTYRVARIWNDLLVSWQYYCSLNSFKRGLTSSF